MDKNNIKNNSKYKKEKINSFLDYLGEIINNIKINKNEYLNEMINLNYFYLEQNKYLEKFYKIIFDNLEIQKKEKKKQLEFSRNSCEEIYNNSIKKYTNFINELNVINKDINKNYTDIINNMDTIPFDNILSNYNTTIELFENKLKKLTKQPKIITENLINIKNNNEEKILIQKLKNEINLYITNEINNSILNTEQNYYDKSCQTKNLIKRSNITQKSVQIQTIMSNFEEKDELKLKAKDMITAVDNLILKRNNINFQSSSIIQPSFQSNKINNCKYNTSDRNAYKSLSKNLKKNKNDVTMNSIFKKKIKKKALQHKKESSINCINFNKRNKYNKIIINYKNILNNEKISKKIKSKKNISKVHDTRLKPSKSCVYKDILDKKSKSKSFANKLKKLK